MYYAIYKNVRNSAWSCLLDNNITSLPVNVLKIAQNCGVKVIKNSDANELEPDEDAKTYYDGEKWIIIYNNLNDVCVSRYAIAHELGHIFLGHATTHTKYSNVLEFGRKPKAEQLADNFALRLLCPACVLSRINAISPAEIASTCRIPLSHANIRSRRIKRLRDKDMFLASDLELEIFNSFKPYISAELAKKDSAKSF